MWTIRNTIWIAIDQWYRSSSDSHFWLAGIQRWFATSIQNDCSSAKWQANVKIWPSDILLNHCILRESYRNYTAQEVPFWRYNYTAGGLELLVEFHEAKHTLFGSIFCVFQLNEKVLVQLIELHWRSGVTGREDKTKSLGNMSAKRGSLTVSDLVNDKATHAIKYCQPDEGMVYCSCSRIQWWSILVPFWSAY